MLEVSNLSAAYGKHQALQNVSLRVDTGEIVVILGANGAGKSTLLRAVAGVCEARLAGEVSLDGASLRSMTPDVIVDQGVAFVPEGRGIFGDLTVGENLLLGAYAARARAREAENLDRVLRLFPKLSARKSQIVRTMSGGEQQMVAIGRALMSDPKYLLLDEPSLGLSPILCKELFGTLRTVKSLGIGVLMVEQNARQSLAIADRGYLLENTQITHEASASVMASDPKVQKAYLGSGASSGAKAVQPPVDVPSESLQSAARLSQDVPPMVARPPRRLTADEQVGFSIDEIVNNAAQQASRASSSPKPHAAEVERLTSSRVETILGDMERAARHASSAGLEQTSFHRTLRLPDRHVPGATHMTPPQPRENRAQSEAKIVEVYRRPRVAVYRRSAGDFERK